VKPRARIVRLFVASPSDTADEQQIVKAAIDDLNRSYGRDDGFRIDLLGWKTDSYPAIGADGQDVINRQIGDYDILLGLMSTRYGSPTGRASSGTVEEFDRAWARLIERPEAVRIMFYFHDPVIRLSAIDPYEILQIQRFKQRLRDIGILHGTYESPDQLGIHLRNHIPKVVRELLSANPSARRPRTRSVHSISPVAISDWRASKNVYPQWADYLPIPLERYSYRSFSLTGDLHSNSPYFRFGFKLFPLAGREFGESAIPSDGANLLVHVGKNLEADTLFLTSYYNGMRQGPNRSLLDYSTPRKVPIAMEVTPDDVFTMTVNGASVYRVHINQTITKRLIVLAWGDEHEFDVEFTNVVLRLS
jgi:hypothetical protein